jgi:hypothetical protein
LSRSRRLDFCDQSNLFLLPPFVPKYSISIHIGLVEFDGDGWEAKQINRRWETFFFAPKDWFSWST